jgi:lysophospholipase L1-like esterase
MPSTRAAKLQKIIIVLVVLVALAMLAIGLQVVRIGTNAAMSIISARVVLNLFGSILLLTAFVSLFWVRWRVIQAKFFFSAVFFLVMLLGLEVAARVAGFVPAPPHPNLVFWAPDSELGFVSQPNCKFRYLAASGWIDGTTDGSGFRPVIAAKDDANAPEVICLGDSTTFSAEMEDEKTWPEAAGRYLAGKGKPCHMLNRAVYGYSGLQSMIMLRRVLKKPGNAKAVVYHFCINDPGENFFAFMPCPFLEPAGKSFTIKPPAEPMATFSQVQLRPEFALLAAFRTWRFSTGDAAYLSGANAGYPFNVINCDKFVKDQKLRDGMRYVVSGMKEECDRHNLPLFVSAVCFPYWDHEGPTQSDLVALVHPANIADDSRIYNASCDTLKQIVTDVGATYIDLRGCLDGMTYRDYVASPLDWHFSPAANERIGKAIAEKLESRIK